jgi:hypothetical protein
MTLIVSCLRWERFVIQITDRQLTTLDGRKFDELSNKTLVYMAKDAIVSMAYTGPAYIEDWPIDCWIAWKLWGKPLDRFRETGGGFATRVPPLQCHIGQAIRLLESELKASEIAREKRAFELNIVGLKWKLGKNALQGKKRTVPAQWKIVQERGGEITTQYFAPIYRPGFRLHAIPDTNISMAQLQGMSGRVRRILEGDAEDKPRQIEDDIVRSIRDIAALNPFVGSNCMSVSIVRHRHPLVRIRFFPSAPYRACDLGMESVPEGYEASFCPWIISPTVAIAPQISVGGWWAFEWCGVRVQVEANQNEIIFDPRTRTATQGFSDHIRPRRPR